jgi:hypothetical protein
LNTIGMSRVATSIRIARLLDPSAAKAEGRLTQRPDLDGYLLAVKVSDEYVCRFEEPGVRKVGVCFHLHPLPSGVMLAVPTIQVGGIQTRVAVPLFDKKSIEWAHWCVASKKVSWLLDIGEKYQVALLSFSQNFSQVDNLHSLIDGSRQDVSAYKIALDMARATKQLTGNSAIVSCIPREKVTEVNLGLVQDFCKDSFALKV